MFLILNADGSIASEVDGGIGHVERAAEKLFPKHTPIYANFDLGQAEREHGIREANPVENSPAIAMQASGLPWNPSAPRPGGGKGVGITMGEVLAAYPMDKAGLENAWRDLLPYFPHTPGTRGYYVSKQGKDAGKRKPIAEEFGFEQWRTPGKMVKHMLRTNTKT